MSELQDIKNELARRGVNPNTTRMLEGERRVRESARKIWNDQNTTNSIRWLSRTAQTLVAAVASLFVMLLIVVGIGVGPIGLGIAEYEAVNAGLLSIDPERAAIYSIAIVGFYPVLLFIRQLISAKINRGQVEAFSFRGWFSRFTYIFGLRRNWKPEQAVEKNMLVSIDGAISAIMWTIAVFGVMGRLHIIAEKYAAGKPMVEGISSIVTQAELMDVLGLFGVLLMTIALLMSVHFIVYFVYNVFKSVAGEVDVIQNFSEVSLAEIEDRAAKNYYESFLARSEGLEKSRSADQHLQ